MVNFAPICFRSVYLPVVGPMNAIESLLTRSQVHPRWQPLLMEAGRTMDEAYLEDLLADSAWLPGPDKIFAAFQRDLEGVQYVLFGESPYPRKASANGIAFYDAAVDGLWSDSGLSKSVNRATSLRNILKTALVAEGRLVPTQEGKIPQSLVAEVPKAGMVQTIAELFEALQRVGFLMLNATPVLHPDRKPNREARYWQQFMERFLNGLQQARGEQLPTLVLWGKIAEQIQSIPCANRYPQLVCEHPYNLSFIDNTEMRTLFGKIRILAR